jgi:tRNA (guanine37-N1)-methyltransferase
MWCGVVTLFPEMFQALTEYGVTGRAVERGLLTLEYWNPRDFASDKHRTVDDRPYGGGPGMVMGVTPLRDAIHAAKAACEGSARVIHVSPQGRLMNQSMIQNIDSESRLIFIAGRYEGVDERLIQLEVDEEWSIGDYVLSGGELAIMVIIDALTRWIPGVLGHELSAQQDSFSQGLLECPQYTRPEEIAGLRVPEVLLSGDHANIARYRLKQSLGRTWQRRPELLDRLDLNAESRALLQEFIKEQVS